MHHQDAGADECRQYTQGHFRPRRAPLLQEITIMRCSTRFHSALTRSTSLVSFNTSAEKEVYCFILQFFFFSGMLLCTSNVCFFFCLCRKRVSEGKDQTKPSLWLQRALCQTIILCIAICRLSHCRWLTSLTACQGFTLTNRPIQQPPLLLRTGME